MCYTCTYVESYGHFLGFFVISNAASEECTVAWDYFFTMASHNFEFGILISSTDEVTLVAHVWGKG
ncbi:hypothetical protein COLO4_20603 [Corchorus olitorius]|uniref:Uncharacterized protein n=1 Tax=Corchorus olitorius TaxID=93759 RepID=A0A1R3IYT0_9ROSI|nr:hypothetical protein COLO4_20603 [Corchorus olitorius]